MIYWNQILYTIRNYNLNINILNAVPEIHYKLFGTFNDLPLELGGIRKRRRTLEDKLVC